ncbi:hypothetical protein GBN33_16645 [Plesiomonas shigelloides]|uniref:hypothetical protein n=1 Tax=Plesiomonas shigelloides TaxID=703 RepID=UPI001262334F|nr:hypothetical protein [Plesiomonas shigelloides]KAB7694293.1 hypothetical protein GBN33_16645 [Plesiomonas shigelloides]
MISIVPKWCNLRLVGNSKVVKLTIFMPFIGYLILFNNEIVNYFALSNNALGLDPSITESMSFSRLYQLYFGLMLVGVASALFSIFCPPIVKANDDEYSYYEKELFSMTTKRIAQIADSLADLVTEDKKSELKSLIDSYNSAFSDAHRQKYSGNVVEGDVYSVAEKYKKETAANILNMEWSFRIESMPKMRTAIAMFYGTGFLILLYPSANVFLRVCSVVWGKFCG